MKINKELLIKFGLILVFKFLLEISYVFVVRKVWPDYGFPLIINYLKLLESYVILTIIFFIAPNKENKPSTIIITILYLITIIPLLSLYALEDESRIYMYLVATGFSLTIIIIRFLPQIKLIRIKNGRLFLFIFITFITILTYALMIKDNGIPNLIALNILRVYEIRGNIYFSFSFITYLLNWQTTVINPFLIGLFYVKKHYKKMFLVIIMQIFLYLQTGHKTFLFSIPLIIGTIYLIRKKQFTNLLIKGFLGLTVICLISGMLFYNYIKNINIIVPSALFTFRLLFLPAEIQFNYYDFFSNNPLMYFAESQIGKLFGTLSPYNMPSANLISDVYFNKPGMSSNTAYLADAYMNLGVIGVILYSMLLGLLIKIIDSISEKADFALTMSVFIYPMFYLTNVPLLTVILTQGLFLSIIIMLFYGNSKEDSVTNIRGDIK